MAGQRARSAAAAGTEPVPTRAQQTVLRRAARFEESVAVAESPLEQIRIAADALRSLLKTVSPEVGLVFAGEFVSLCRHAITKLTSENSAKEADVRDAARTAGQRPTDQGTATTDRAPQTAPSAPGRRPHTPRPGIGPLGARAVGHG